MTGRYDQAYAALHVVVDPELDEPITDLGFVRSLVVTPAGNVKLHVRLRLVLFAELRLPDDLGCQRRSHETGLDS